MDSITLTGMEDEEKGSEDKKKGHGRKIRATKSYKKKKDKRAVAVMISISNEGVFIEDSTLTEKERADKELAKLVPLHTDWWSVEVLSTERCQVVDFIIGKWVEWDSSRSNGTLKDHSNYLFSGTFKGKWLGWALFGH
ncbi:hypothetical protein FXO38_28707 [Capsicum annuum]|nr:hypothetical protein FXO38_28707 [Capsicum annuum]